MDVEARVQTLAEDRQRGASEITDDARDLLSDLADDGRDAVADAGIELVQAHPAMAPLFNLVNEALLGWDDEGPGVLDRLRDEADVRRQDLVEEVADLADDGATVATYSRSGTVVAGLAQAATDRAVRVRVGEGRPGMEGLSVARDLDAAGADVTVTTDAALVSELDDVDLALVGADAICAEGFVNKIGTSALLRSAEADDVGLVVACGSDKRLPTAWRRAPPIDRQGTLDVDVPDGIAVEAPLFEVAPLDPITAIVTEDGPRPPAMVVDGLDRMPVHPRLQEVVDDG